MIERWHTRFAPAAPLSGSHHLWCGDARYKPERGKHFDVFLEEWSELADCLLAAVCDIEENANCEIFPELQLLASTGSCIAISLDRSFRHSGSSTTDSALNA